MKFFITVFILIMNSFIVKSQISKTSVLYKDLKTQDSIFFERGFNQCDLEFLDKAIHKDLRFFHDQSGIQNREVFFENTRKYICGDPNRKPVRKVDEQSLEVFPLYNQGKIYGAIQTGTHRFFLREKGKDDLLTGSASFTHVYVLENDQWLLMEVLSFDHQDLSKK